jgi:hypothetical protein
MFKHYCLIQMNGEIVFVIVHSRKFHLCSWLFIFLYFTFFLKIDSKSNDSHGLLKLFEVYRRSKVPKLITQQITIETIQVCCLSKF